MLGLAEERPRDETKFIMYESSCKVRLMGHECEHPIFFSGSRASDEFLRLMGLRVSEITMSLPLKA